MNTFPLMNIFIVLLFFLRLDFPENSATAEEQDSPRHEHASSVRVRPKRTRSNRPYIVFNTKSPVYLVLRRNTVFRIKTRIFGASPVIFRWMKNDTGLTLGYQLKTANRGRQLVLQPPFTEADSGKYSVLACNNVGCTIRGVQVVCYEENLFETEINRKTDRGTDIVAWIGGTIGVVFIVSLVTTAVILRRYWVRWIFMKRVKEEYRSQTTSLHGGNDPCSWLWTWRTASQAGFNTTEHEEVNEYDDVLRINTKKAEHKNKTRQQHTGATKKTDSSGQPNAFKQLHYQHRPKETLPLNARAFQRNIHGSPVDGWKGQGFRADSSKGRQMTTVISNARKPLPVLKQSSDCKGEANSPRI